jgi:hypothetical protein
MGKYLNVSVPYAHSVWVVTSTEIKIDDKRWNLNNSHTPKFNIYFFRLLLQRQSPEFSSAVDIKSWRRHLETIKFY